MYARVATFEGGDLERIRQMSEERRQQPGWMPEGVKRTMVLNNPDSGKRHFITFFDSREELDAAAQRFDQMGDEIPEDVRGRRTGVDVYEVLADETV
jgi:hypothetical protein